MTTSLSLSLPCFQKRGRANLRARDEGEKGAPRKQAHYERMFMTYYVDGHGNKNNFLLAREETAAQSNNSDSTLVEWSSEMGIAHKRWSRWWIYYRYGSDRCVSVLPPVSDVTIGPSRWFPADIDKF